MVVVSLPGFGFSDPPTQKGYGLAETAKTINQIMINLGYNEYSKLDVWELGVCMGGIATDTM